MAENEITMIEEQPKAPDMIDKETGEVIKTKDIVIDGVYALKIEEQSKEMVEHRVKQINGIAEVLKNEMKNGTDYGIIPGTKNPTLYKAGAEKVMLMYNLYAKYTILEKNIDKETGFVEYEFKAELFTRQGNQFVSEGYGHMDNDEKGAKGQPRNTILKKAKKRAMVDAVLAIGNLSATFTQDLEDGQVNNEYLSKDEKLGLYQLAYAHFDAKTKKQKDWTKAYLKNVFVKLELPAHFLAFTNQEQKQKFIDWTNDPNNSFENIMKKEKENE